MQIHVILCFLQPNQYGFVDANYFLRVCCTIIPHMFDSLSFMGTAEEIAREKADAQAKAELEQLTGAATKVLAYFKLTTFVKFIQFNVEIWIYVENC